MRLPVGCPELKSQHSAIKPKQVCDLRVLLIRCRPHRVRQLAKRWRRLFSVPRNLIGRMESQLVMLVGKPLAEPHRR